jgi:dihydroxyacetone kinase-like predicted kinase
VGLTALDGRGFEKFVAAGTYFLRKYRGVLDELNVFPVADGDTGSNMYLTARSALAELGKVRGGPLAAVAAEAAEGSLLGARGNSGVILSQMLRGFAHNVRHRPAVDTLDLVLAMREGVAAARARSSSRSRGRSSRSRARRPTPPHSSAPQLPVLKEARGLGAQQGGLLTLYYGGAQKERDARQISAKFAAAFSGLEVEYYYGGQRATEYVISLER